VNNAPSNSPGTDRGSLAAGATSAPHAPGPEPRPFWPRLLAYRMWILVGLLVLALDQLTKFWIVARLPYQTFSESGGAIPIVRGFLTLVHVGNTGAAWSMFSGMSVLLALLAVSTLVAIVIWRHTLGLRDRTTQVCFGLLCGGIAGNLVDRLIHHHVVDFIDLYFARWDYHYPTFNVADSGICIGVILYLWHGFREK